MDSLDVNDTCKFPIS